MGKDTVKTAADGSVEEALKRCVGTARDQSSLYCVLGYENKNTLKVLAQGEGGLEDVLPHFGEDCVFALLRVALKVELANTVKMAYLCWSPDTIKPMRKAMLSIHKPQVKTLMEPFHVMLELEDQRDLEGLQKQIDDKIGFSAGTKVHVTEKAAYAASGGGIATGVNNTAGARKKRADFQGGRSGDLVSKDAQKIRGLSFEDEDAVRAAITAVRSDDNDIDWCLVGYSDIKTLKLHGQGSGGPDALSAAMDDAQVWYGYIKLTETIDRSTTVKFGFVTQMTTKLAPVKRAKVSTHRGFVTDLFRPSHIEFTIGHPSEISLDIAMEKLGSYTGTKSNVTDKKESKLSGMMYTHAKKQQTGMGGADTNTTDEQQEKVNFSDKDALSAAVDDVRDDNTDTDFMVVTWDPKSNELALTATGAGGLDALKAACEPKGVHFALLRTTDKVDKTVAVKFVYIKQLPPSLAPISKAKISTKKGAIDPVFAPFHVDFFVDSTDELTDAVVADKVSAMAGTKQWAQ